jgi:hypothetical protein
MTFWCGCGVGGLEKSFSRVGWQRKRECVSNTVTKGMVWQGLFCFPILNNSDKGWFGLSHFDKNDMRFGDERHIRVANQEHPTAPLLLLRLIPDIGTCWLRHIVVWMLFHCSSRRSGTDKTARIDQSRTICYLWWICCDARFVSFASLSLSLSFSLSLSLFPLSFLASQLCLARWCGVWNYPLSVRQIAKQVSPPRTYELGRTLWAGLPCSRNSVWVRLLQVFFKHSFVHHPSVLSYFSVRGRTLCHTPPSVVPTHILFTMKPPAHPLPSTRPPSTYFLWNLPNRWLHCDKSATLSREIIVITFVK